MAIPKKKPPSQGPALSPEERLSGALPLPPEPPPPPQGNGPWPVPHLNFDREGPWPSVRIGFGSSTPDQATVGGAVRGATGAAAPPNYDAEKAAAAEDTARIAADARDRGRAVAPPRGQAETPTPRNQAAPGPTATPATPPAAGAEPYAPGVKAKFMKFNGKIVGPAPEGNATIRPDAGGGLYSDKLRALELDMPRIDTSTPGGAVLHETPGGPYLGLTGPRSRTTTLSGLEQAVARRDWLEGRVGAEQANESADAKRAEEQARSEAAIKYSQVDPLDRARIEAAGKYGGAQVTAASEEAARAHAIKIYQGYVPQFRAVAQAIAAARTVEERAALQKIQEGLQREAEIQAGLAIGKVWPDPKQNPLAALLGGALGGATPAATPAGTQG